MNKVRIQVRLDQETKNKMMQRKLKHDALIACNMNDAYLYNVDPEYKETVKHIRDQCAEEHHASVYENCGHL